MMQNSEDGFLAVMGSHRAPIILRLSEFNGRKTIDLRRYFYATNSEDPLPTQKGVSLDRDGFSLMRAALDSNQDLIAAWLASNSEHTLSSNALAVEQFQSALRSHTSDFESWKSPTFFHVAAEGATDHLTLNSAHPLNSTLQELRAVLAPKSASVVSQLIEAILVSYYRSKMLFEGVGEMKAEDIFETLELNWGIILRQYADSLREELKTNE
jgi:Transcriptional Coactivator p15 (PC4)